jgi:ssDNA-binding replication factor A large subunit
MDNYLSLIERIAYQSKLSKEEIERKVEAKRAKLSGLVSKEGAAQIVAAELGINFEKEKMKISELVQGMKKANIVGKIINVSPVREYNKNGKSGKVANLVVADESSNVKVVLWDTNHIGLIEQKKLNLGDVVEISNGNMRNGEVHLSSFGDIKLSESKMDNVVTEKIVSFKKLSDAKSGEHIKTRAFVVQSFDPRYFEVCPECKKGVHEGECKLHGKVQGIKRALINVVIDDGHGSIRSVIFGDTIKKLGLEEEEIFDIEKFHAAKHKILGEEKVFSGNVRSNQLYNTIEFNIEGMENVNAGELIKELEAKQ